MKRAPLLVLLALLLVASLVAGVWLFRPARTAAPPEAPTCEGATCEATTTQPAAAPAASSGPPRSHDAAPPPPPADAATLRAEADRLIADGKIEAGIEKLRRATAADPSLANHADLGRLLYRLAIFQEAARHLRAAADLDPGNADRWIAAANAYYRTQDLGEAWAAEKRARAAEPGLVLGRDASGMRVRK